MANVFITYQIPAIAEDILRQAGHDVTVREADDLISDSELEQALGSHDGLITLLTDKISASTLKNASSNLKVIANYAVGYDNIDTKAAAERGITITNTPDVLTDAVAEYTLALVSAISRRIVEADAFTKAGNYHGWRPMLLLGNALKGKTLGIVGVGRIGYEVAKRAHHGFGMSITYNDLKPSSELETDTDAKYMEKLDDLLSTADVVSIHVPLLDATHHLIDAAALDQMKETAYLINTSRGPVVDETALVKALQGKKIRGAALDVFENEPELAPGLAELDTVIVTPHVASATIEARSAMAKLAAENVVAVLAGEAPLTPVT